MEYVSIRCDCRINENDEVDIYEIYMKIGNERMNE
jgi:hypothetical protein